MRATADPETNDTLRQYRPQTNQPNRDLVERIADAVDLAVDAGSWSECVDILMDLSDTLRRVLKVSETTVPRDLTTVPPGTVPERVVGRKAGVA